MMKTWRSSVRQRCQLVGGFSQLQFSLQTASVQEPGSLRLAVLYLAAYRTFSGKNLRFSLEVFPAGNANWKVCVPLFKV